MGMQTAIEWTDHTFNIAWGCVKVSPGCQHCYADTLSRRYGHDVWGPAKTTARRTFGAKHWTEPLKWNAKAERDGVRRRVFCSSMCDVFEDHPTIDAEREKLWPLIRATPWLDWQLLTKRPERIAANLPSDWGIGYPNVWLGTSVEAQAYVEERVPLLTRVHAARHFLSCEPLLGPLNLTRIPFGTWFCKKWHTVDGASDLYVNALHGVGGRPSFGSIDWVIAGGESGPGARPCETDWLRSLRDQCQSAGVAFFLKQLGGARDKRGHENALLDGVRYIEMPSPSSPTPTAPEA